MIGYYINIIIASIFGGYLVNRTIYWVGAILCEWSKGVIYNQYWFNKGTTIKSLIRNIRYEDYDIKYENKYAKHYLKENLKEKDSFSASHDLRFLPFLNLLICIPILCYHLIMFILAILIIICRLICYCLMIFWKYIGKYIYNFIKKCIDLFILFLKKIKIIYLIKSFYQLLINIQNKFLNLKIS